MNFTRTFFNLQSCNKSKHYEFKYKEIRELLFLSRASKDSESVFSPSSINLNYRILKTWYYI